VVILAGYTARFDILFRRTPGMAGRIAHHIDFPDYALNALVRLSELMLARMHDRLANAAMEVLRDYIGRRMRQPRFSNA